MITKITTTTDTIPTTAPALNMPSITEQPLTVSMISPVNNTKCTFFMVMILRIDLITLIGYFFSN